MPLGGLEGGGGGSAIIEVANYSALPSPIGLGGELYAVLASQGTKWLPGSLGGTYYPKGLYYSDNVNWVFTETPYNANQATVDAGTNDDQFVTSKTFNDSAQLAAKAPLASPTFTGVVTTPDITVTGLTTTRVVFATTGGALTDDANLTFGSGNLNIGTSVTTPLLIGGSAVGDKVSVKATTGNGTLTATAFELLVGNNGATVPITVLNNGRVGINNTTPNNADSIASEISIGNSSKAATGITFFTTTTSASHLFFADGNSGGALYRGAISYRHATDDLLLRAGWNGSSTTGLKLTTSTLVVDHQPATTGATTPFSFTTPASTTQTASTETIGFRVNMSATIQHATGTITTQRDSVFDARTHTAVGASVITNAATLAITGAPIAGTNATITNGYALWLQSGNMLISSGTLSIGAPTASPMGASVFTSNTGSTGANTQNPSGMAFVHAGTGFGSTIYYGIGIQNRSLSALSAGMGVGILMGLGYGSGSFVNTRITSYAIGTVSSSLDSAFGIQTSIGGTAAERFTFYKESFGINTTTPNSYLNVNGSFSTAYVQKTAAYVITSSDFTIECTSGTFDITLPTAVGIKGRIYVIANSGAGTITLATTSSQTIDGNASGVLTLTQNKSYTVQSNNSNWVIIAVK